MPKRAVHVVRAATLALLVVAAASCANEGVREAPPSHATQDAFLDSLSRRTFHYFWDLSDPAKGLTPDRWPTRSFSSVAAIGFALTAYPIGAERGWVSRAEAYDRTLATLTFLWKAPQHERPRGATGHRGFFYHFLDPASGQRFEQVELSTIDTALLLAGALFGQSYFDRADEAPLRALVDSIYARVDWTWAQPRPPTVALGWNPESGFLPYDWRGYNEAMILYLLALGSPTHPIEPAAWEAWTANYRVGTFHGQEHLGFPPLFGHQYSHVWVDFRGIRDAWCTARDTDYFENSRRATLAQQAYAIANPEGWADYGEFNWGLTACDGPVEVALMIDGRKRQFHTYWARGASFTDVRDDGTIAPTAAGGSIVFAPEIVIPTLEAMHDTYGERLYGAYGFLDAFNPTLKSPIPVQHGVVDTSLGWFDTDYLGIDQGPILAMIENHRSGLVWNVMKRNVHLRRGLARAGFAGGWLEATR